VCSDAMRAELTRPSKEMELAKQGGMLRPFLCLVAMVCVYICAQATTLARSLRSY
jgi:hypothetical protein